MRIQFEGKPYDFPDDATDEEISSMLSQVGKTVDEEEGVIAKGLGGIAGTGRFLAEGLAAAVASGLGSIAGGAGAALEGRPIMQGAQENMANVQGAIKEGIDFTGFGTGKTAKGVQEMLGHGFEKFVEIGGDAGVFAFESSPGGMLLKQTDPETYDEIERRIRGISEVGTNFVPLPFLGKGKKKPQEEGINKTEVDAFLAERAEREKQDSLKNTIALEQRAKREGEFADLQQIEQGRTAPDLDVGTPKPVLHPDIPAELAEADAPNMMIFEWEEPTLPPRGPPPPPGGGGGGRPIPYEKPGLELAPETPARAAPDMVDPGTLSREGVDNLASRVERMDETASGSRSISDVVRDMRAEMPVDRPPEAYWLTRDNPNPPDLRDLSGFDPFRNQLPKVEKVQGGAKAVETTTKAAEKQADTAAAYLARTKKEQSKPAGATRAGRGQRGSFGDVTKADWEPQDPKRVHERNQELADPIVGAAVHDTKSGKHAGPFNNHGGGKGGVVEWMQDFGRSAGFAYGRLVNGFITRNGRFLTREEAGQLTGGRMSESFPFFHTQEHPGGIGARMVRTGRPIDFQSPQQELKAITGEDLSPAAQAVETPARTLEINTEMLAANAAKLRKGPGGKQAGAVMNPAAALDAIRERFFGPGKKPVPTKGEFGDFKDALPDELKPQAKALYDEFKAQKTRKDIDAVRSNPVEEAVNRESMFDGLKGYVPETRDFDSVAPILKGSGDIQGGLIGDAKNATVAGGKLKAQLSRNPVVKYGVDIIHNGIKAAQAAAHRRLFHKDTGILQVIKRLSKKEQEGLWGVMRKYNGTKWLTPEELIREGLNDKQITAYDNYRQQIGQAWNDHNLARKAKGLDAIPAVEGYVPARWVGRYYVRITDSHGRLLAVEARKGQKELKALVDHLKKTNPEYKVSNILTREDVRTFKFNGESRSARDLFDQIAETLGRDSFEKQVLDQIIQDYNALQPGKHRFGKHYEEKTGVSGYMGDQAGMSAREQFTSAMESIDGYMHDLYHFTEMQKVHENVSKLLNPDNGIEAPNAKAYVEKYLQHALRMENQFSQTQRHVLESIPKALGMDPALIQRLSRSIRKNVVYTMLGYWRPSFLAAQVFQPIQMMLPTITEFRLRAPNEAYTNSRAIAMAKGWADALHPEGSSALAKEAVKYAHERGVLNENLLTDIAGINEMSQKGFIGEAWSWVNGEKPMRFAEDFARRAAYLQAVHALEGSRLTKAEMFGAAGDIMDMAMTNYAAHEKAMGFTAMGEAGSWISPLQSFKMNWVSQRLKFAKLIAENPKSYANYKPLAQSIVMDLLLAGIMGTALLKEIDVAIALLKKVGLLDADADDATGHLLKYSSDIQGQGRDFVRYGALSGATGYDFSPQYAMTQVFPHSWKELFPVANKAMDMATAAYGMASNNPLVGGEGSTSEDQAKMLSLLPGPAKAAGEYMMAGEDGMIPNPNRNMEGKVQRDASGYVGSALGAGAISEKEQGQAVMQNVKMEQQITQRKVQLLDKIKERYADGKDITAMLDEFVDLGGTPKEFLAAIKMDQKNRNSTQFERAMKPPTNYNQMRQQMRIEEYGVR